MSAWKPEFFIPGEGWCGNRLVFRTEEEAARWASGLARWDSRTVPTDEEPNYKLREAGKIELLGGRHDGAVVRGTA